MTLRAKTLAILGATLVVLFVALYLTLRLITIGSFSELERRQVEADVGRTENAMDAEVERVDSVVGDWAPWDDTWEFVRGEYPDYPESNLDADTLGNLGVNFMLFFDADDRLVYGIAVDLDEWEEADLPDYVVEYLDGDGTLLEHDDWESEVSGVLDLPEQPMIFSSQPIVKSDYSGEIAGTLVAGRYIDDLFVEELSDATQLDLDVESLSFDETPGNMHESAMELAATGEDALVVPVNAEIVAGYGLYPGVDGDPALGIRMTEPRSVYAQGQDMLVFFSIALLVAAGVFAVSMLLVVERFVLARVSLLGASVDEIADSGDVTARITVHGNDEIAVLAGEVNTMLDALEEGEDELRRAQNELEARVRQRTAQLTEVNEVLEDEIRERRRAEAQLAYMASHDHLTGLYNRRRFEEELEMELARIGRSGGCGSLLWLDLDFFKEVNDSLGHAAGDELLLSLSMFLKDKTRDDSLLARLGGDEFAVLLPSADMEQAQAAAHRLLEAVSGNEFQVGRHPVRVSVSVGIVSFPQHGTSVAELLARADLAMYHAKDEGRNRACVYQPEADWHSELQRRMTWRERIEEALEADDFDVYAQPVIDLSDDSVARYELLVRMIGEDGAIIMPGSFLPAAERLGLIHRIDRWMVREAIHLIERHREHGVRLDVNLSGRAFEDKELLPLIERELEQSDVDPSSLGLEITETAAIVDMAKAQHFIERLGSLGCRFSLDDFGSGFSSFYYLKQLPIDGLKIDGAFIQSLPTSEKDQHLVRAIVELSRGLGTQVTAEFVESAEILSLLRDYHVDCAQGYYIGVPGPVEEVLAAGASPTAE